MTNTMRRTLMLPLTVSTIIAMSACASDEDSAGSAESAPASLQADATDDTGDDTTGATGGSSSADLPAGSDTTLVGLAAIATAEGAVGGAAYEIDDQDDDGTWEVDVRSGDGSIEVTVSADGTEVIEQENDDLDDDDKAGLDAASITLTAAIETAVGQSGGTLDDAELETDNGQHYWEVTLDTDQQDDLEVYVSVTGQVIQVTDDDNDDNDDDDDN